MSKLRPTTSDMIALKARVDAAKAEKKVVPAPPVWATDLEVAEKFAALRGTAQDVAKVEMLRAIEGEKVALANGTDSSRSERPVGR